MAYAFSVEHLTYGEVKKALFLDRERAEEYAIRYHGVVFELGKVCQENSSKTSLPLSMTNKDASCQLLGTVMQKPTH